MTYSLLPVKAEGHVEPVTEEEADTAEANCTGSGCDSNKLYLPAIKLAV
jgi:hypothetical protein